MAEPDAVILKYEHLQSRPREAEALQLLKKIGHLVTPIMQQRGWKVGVLREIFSTTEHLLGYNLDKGAKIFIRLRKSTDESEFLDVEYLVSTMLHELAHIVYEGHGMDHWVLCNQLREEFKDLVSAGYTDLEPPVPHHIMCEQLRAGFKAFVRSVYAGQAPPPR